MVGYFSLHWYIPWQVPPWILSFILVLPQGVWKLPDSFHIWEVGVTQQGHIRAILLKCPSSQHACHLKNSQLVVYPLNHSTFNFADHVTDLRTARFNPEPGGQGTCSHAFLPLGRLLPHILPRAEGVDSFFSFRRDSQCIPALVTEFVIANEMQGEKHCC